MIELKSKGIPSSAVPEVFDAGQVGTCKAMGEIKNRKITIWIDRDLTEVEATVFFIENPRVCVLQCPTGFYRREDFLDA